MLETMMSLLTGVLGVVLFLIGSPAIGQLQLPVNTADSLVDNLVTMLRQLVPAE